MKKQQVMALLLCGTLAFGQALPAMAADVQDGEGQKTEAPAEPVEEKEAEKEVEKETPDSTPEHMISEAMLKSMSENLTDLINQVEAEYGALNDTEKAGVEEALKVYFYGKFNSGYGLFEGKNFTSFSGTIAQMKSTVSVEMLKAFIEKRNPDAANKILDMVEADVVETVDALRYCIHEGKTFVADEEGKEYALSKLKEVQGNLNAVITSAGELLEADYIAELQNFLDASTKISNEKPETIMGFVEAAFGKINEIDKHLNRAYWEEALKAAEAYGDFLALAPESLMNVKVFDGYGSWGKVTYKDSAAYAKEVAAEIKEMLKEWNTVTYEVVSGSAPFFKGNIAAAYDGVAAAFLETVAVPKEIAAVNYDGPEKAAFEAALAEYKATCAGENYAGYAPAAKKLQNALNVYIKAVKAEREVIKQKKAAAVKKIEALHDYVNDHSTYFTEESMTAINALELEAYNADVTTISMKEMNALIAAIDKLYNDQDNYYSEEMLNLIENVQQFADDASAWWDLIPAEVQEEETYAEAVALTEKLETALVNTEGVYDIDKLQAAYEDFKDDVESEDSKVHSAAKAVAEYVLANAEKTYEEELKKPHNEGVLEALEEEIASLKAAIKDWDYKESITAAAETKKAQEKVTNDKVEDKDDDKKDDDKKDDDKKEEEKKDNNKKDDKKKDNAAANTGDATDAGTPGMFGLLSLAGIAAVLGKKFRS